MTDSGYRHDYPPGEWTADGIATALESTLAESPLPRYEDAATWESFRADDLTGPVVAELLERARADRDEPVPSLPASLYLDYARTGNRTRYEARERERTHRLARFTVAECFEREGEFLDPVLDYAWAACERTTWVLPAHLDGNPVQDREGLPGVVPDDERHIALRSAGLARQLAEIDYVLGDRLHPALRERIRHEVDRRIFTPFEARDDLNWMIPPVANWSAVCNAGVGIAAVHLLDSPERQGRILAKVAHLLEDYLADFDADGCTAEGVHYWNYGMGHYAALAAHLEAGTGGEYSLFSPPVVREIAQYPLRIEMSPGRFVPFSDTQVDERVDPYTACLLGLRFDLPGLAVRGRRSFAAGGPGWRFGDFLRTLGEVRRVPSDLDAPPLPKRSHLTGHDWWLARADPADPDGLVVASKGGHNDESHNHNDLGTVVVHAGGESLLADLGRPVYDADFFGTDARYDYLTARSLGHNVPYVNGVEQAAGDEFRAEVVERTDGEVEDSFALDLTDAYPGEARIDSLRRTVTLDRASEGVTVADDVAFDGSENEFVEVFVSFAPVEATDAGIEVRGTDRTAVVTADPGPSTVEVEHLGDAVQGNDVWRARLAYRADESLGVELGVRTD